MKATRQMTVARRLWMGFGLLILLTLVTAGLGAWGLVQSEAALKTVYEDRAVPLNQLANINYLVTRNRLILTDATMAAKPEVVQRRQGEFEANRKTIDKDWAAYAATSMTAEELALMKTVDQSRKALDEALVGVMKALAAGNFAAAEPPLQQAGKLSAPYREAMEKLLNLQVQEAANEYKAAQARADKLHLASAALIVLAVIAAGLVAFLLTRGLTRALGAEPAELAEVAGRIAQGSL
ncbi:MAG TPA: MCP four helix bundle domain-containing protein, partial [Rubrivivax sp.]|nr:MCP four helix bundle domain-containing protein [Rubrivivax sp.]